MKNLTIFRSSPAWKPDFSLLDSNLSIPGKLGYSWKVLRDGLPYIKIGNDILLCCELQKKLLPAQVVNTATKIRVEAIEKERDYKVGKTELRNIKDDVLKDLFDKAFVVSKLINVWINTDEKLLCIDTTSPIVADDVMVRLIRDFDYKGRFLKPARHVGSFMHSLLLSRGEFGFEIGTKCVMQDEDKKSVSVKNEIIDTDDADRYASQGKTPQKLELFIDDPETTFTINKDFVISGISYPVKIEESEYEDVADYQNTLIALDAGHCIAIVNRLLEQLGEQKLLSEEAV